jgi:LysR family transcriptional regulator, regulator of abg operon
MRLQQLRDLMGVVQHGGFRAAATATGVTQGGLSKSIARLEQDLGLALLERRPDGPVLTVEGEAFLSHAKAILQEADRADDWLARMKTGKTGSISLGLSIEPSLQLAPKVLSHFRSACPGITVQLTQSVTSRLLAALRENRIDIAVMLLTTNFEAADLTCKLIYQVEPAVVGRKNHPCAHATTVREIAHCDWMVVAGHSEEDAGINQLFTEAALGAPRIAGVSDSLFCTLTTLLESDTLARLPRSLLAHPLLHGHLMRIPITEPARRYPIAIVHKNSRYLSAQAQTLVAMLTSYARLLYPPSPIG